MAPTSVLLPEGELRVARCDMLDKLIAADILRYYFSAEESREETLTENTLIR